MAGGYWVDLVGERAFTPQLSSPALQLATFDYENLPSQSARDFADLINFATTIPVGHLDLGLDPESTAPPAQPAALGVGPRLTVLLNSASLGAEPLDFGVAASDPGSVPVTRRLTLVNFGAADTLMRGVRITQGSDWFSVPAIPVTTLRPGESLEVEVTFQAQSGVSATGFLAIDSDALAFSGGVELTGSGLQAVEPKIRVGLELNNLGGVAVGQTTSLSALNQLRFGTDGGELPTIFNDGTQPLTISEIRTLAGQGEYFLTSQVFPVVVPPGGSFAFDFQVRYSTTGLRPGVFEIVSDDPLSPLVRLPLVGTGVTFDANVGFPNLDVGNDYVAVSQAETSWATSRIASDWTPTAMA